MRLPATACALAAALAAAALAPATAQTAGTEAAADDCAFLVRAFEGTYQGIRAEEGKMEDADPALVTMYLQIQSNTLQLAQAAGCEVSPMIEIAREQLARYEHEGDEARPQSAPRD